jgi:hypothetical protein
MGQGEQKGGTPGMAECSRHSEHGVSLSSPPLVIIRRRVVRAADGTLYNSGGQIVCGRWLVIRSYSATSDPCTACRKPFER